MTNTRDTHLLAPQYFSGLEKLGVSVSGTYYLDTLNDMLAESLMAKFLYRVYPRTLYQQLNTELLRDVRECNPDLVWIFKGMEIFPETLAQIKAKGIRLVNYNLDHPFRFVSKGSGNANVRKAIPLYDLHMSYSQVIIEELKNKFSGCRTYHLPFGFHDYVRNLSPNDEEIQRVGFVGHGDLERAKVVYLLASHKIGIDLYGPQWKKFLHRPSTYIRIFPPVYGIEYWSTLKKYRVQLNLFRAHNFNSHNMRTFEVPAIGGIMLAPYSPEQAGYFSADQEAFYFNSNEQLMEKIKSILRLSPDQAQKIRLAARQRSLSSEYSYDERSKQVANAFNQLIHG